MSLKSPTLWKGVYESFKEAGGDMDAFESDIWIEKQKAKILSCFDKLDEGNLAASQDYPLPIVVAMMMSQQEHLSILDFGGGMGAQYIELLAKIPHAKEKVKYTIVDGEATLSNRPDRLNTFDNLQLLSSLDSLHRYTFDIVHIGSTLQYIEGWKELLSDMAQKYKPKYFVFSDILAGDVPSFVTHQIFYQKRIPVNILNVEEFKNYMRTHSFFTIYQTLFQNIILGKTTLPNSLLPEKNRLSMASHLIFKRSA